MRSCLRFHISIVPQRVNGLEIMDGYVGKVVRMFGIHPSLCTKGSGATGDIKGRQINDKLRCQVIRLTAARGRSSMRTRA